MECIHMFCDESFVLQQLKKLEHSKKYIKAFNHILNLETKLALGILENEIHIDEKGFKTLLLASFSNKGESETEFALRREKSIQIMYEKNNCIAEYILATECESISEYDKAIELYKRSLEELFPPSMTNYAILLYYGEHCDADTIKAVEILKKSSDLGDEISKDFLKYAGHQE